MRRSMMVLLAFAIVGGAIPQALEAHTCYMGPHALDAARPLPFGPIFEGRVVSMRYAPGSDHDWGTIDVEFEVHGWWNKRVPRRFHLRTSNRYDCGVDFVVGLDYIVAPIEMSDGSYVAGSHHAMFGWDRRANSIRSRLGPARRLLAPLVVRPSLIPGMRHFRTMCESSIPGLSDPRCDRKVDFGLLYSLLAILNLAGLGLALRHADRRFGRGQ